MQVRDQRRDGPMDLRFSNWIVLYPQYLNPSPTVVANLQFRRALMHAVDRQQMVDSLEAGISSVGHNYLFPNQPQFAEIESRVMRYESEVWNAHAWDVQP